MTNNIFILYLVIHIIGDYYLQSEKLAEEKKHKIRNVLLHGLLYLFISLIFIVPIWSSKIFIYTLIFAGTHFIIDIIKFFLYLIINCKRCITAAKFLKREDERGSIYVIDQVLHLVSIYIISHYFLHNNVITSWIPFNICDFTNNFNTNQLLRFTLMTTLLMKPVNITFRKLLSYVKPKEDEKDNNMNNGRLVGNLERLLVAVLLILNQYTAIGLVFTAKSISRYDKIANNKEFAEYYLLGTLFSMLSTLVIYLAIFKL